MTPLTKRQNEVLEFIKAFMRERGKPPSLHEIGGGLGMASTNGVSKHLNALEAKGYIRRSEREARGIDLVDPDEKPGALPYGVVALPLLNPLATSRNRARVFQQPVSHVLFAERILGTADPEQCCVIRVGDAALREAGYPRGALVVAEKKRITRIQERTLVAVLVEDMPTVRYAHYAGGKVHLQAFKTLAAESYERDSDEAFVIGPVCAVAQLM